MRNHSFFFSFYSVQHIFFAWETKSKKNVNIKKKLKERKIVNMYRRTLHSLLLFKTPLVVFVLIL